MTRIAGVCYSDGRYTDSSPRAERYEVAMRFIALVCYPFSSALILALALKARQPPQIPSADAARFERCQRNHVGQLSHAPRRADKDHLRLHRDCHWQFTWRERPSNVGGRIVSRAVLDAGFSTGLCVVC